MLPTYYTISGESQEKPQLSLRFQDGVSSWMPRPWMADESFARMRNEKLEMRNGGAAHKIWKRREV